MIVKRLSVQNFRRFSNDTFDFDQGINIISGPNEAGKSSLLLALKHAIFTDPTTRSRIVLNEIMQWRKGGKSKKPIIEMTFTHGKSEYYLRKDFERKEVTLENKSTKERVQDVKEVQSLLEAKMGISSQEVYESTGCITHDQISSIRKSKTLFSAIQNAASQTGNDGDIQNLLSDLDKEIKELQRGLNSLAKNPGDIKRFQDAVTEKKQNLHTLREQWESIRTQGDKRGQVQQSLKKVKETIHEYEALIGNQKKCEDAQQKLASVQQKLQRINYDVTQIEEHQRKSAQIEVRLGNYKQLEQEDLQLLTDKFSQIDSDIRLKEETIMELQKENDELKSYKPHPLIKSLPFVILIMAIGSTGGFLAKQTIVGIVCMVVAVVGMGILIWQKIFNQRIERKKVIEKKIHELEAVIEQDEQKFETMLTKYGLTSKNDFFTAKQTIEELKFEQKELESTTKALLRGITLEDLIKEQRDLILEKKQIEIGELTDNVVRSKLSPEEYLRKQRELDRMRDEERKLTEELTITATRIGDANISYEEITTKEIELETLEQKLSHAKYTLEVLQETQEYLKKAIQDTSSVAAQIVRKDIEKFLPQLTQDRYDRIRVTDELEIEIFSPEKDEWMEPIGILSAGTVDQIYFLIRVAFIKLVSGEKHPFLLLDDVLVTFDSQRQQQALAILKTISKEYQIFMFSHTPYNITDINAIKLTGV